MAINRSITLGWQGVEHEITLTLLDINTLEKNGEVFELAVAATEHKPRYALTSIVISNIFDIGGADVSADDIYDCLVSSPESKAEIDNMVALIFGAIWPTEKKSDTKLSKTPKS
jgi:hypothetical protein